MKFSSYMNRAMKAQDPRFANVLGKMGYQRTDLVPTPVGIPEDWAALKWPDLRALAGKLSASPIKSKADATAVIEAELLRREA